MCVFVFNEERKRGEQKEKERRNRLHIARISIIILLISPLHTSVCIYIRAYVYVKETMTKEAQRCLRDRARLNDK